MILTNNYTEITGFVNGMIQVAKNYMDFAEVIISTTTPNENDKGFYIRDTQMISFELLGEEKLFVKGRGTLIVQKGFI